MSNVNGLLVAVALVGCTTSEGGVEGDLQIEGADGKADGLNGKTIRIRDEGGLVGGFEKNGWSDTATLIYSTPQQVLISSQRAEISLYNDDNFSGGAYATWTTTNILSLSVSATSATDVGF